MGQIKGWKKVRNSPNRVVWLNEKSQLRLFVVKETRFGRNEWLVLGQTPNHQPFDMHDITEGESFFSKDEAITHTVSYMRKKEN